MTSPSFLSFIKVQSKFWTNLYLLIRQGFLPLRMKTWSRRKPTLKDNLWVSPFHCRNGFTPRVDGFTPRVDGFTPRVDGFTPRVDGFKVFFFGLQKQVVILEVSGRLADSRRNVRKPGKYEAEALVAK